jgi:hypothetical protein
MLQVNNLVGFGTGGSTPSISESSYTGNVLYDGTNKTNFSEDVAIGTADANRLVVLGMGFSGRNNDFPDPSTFGITIGGVSATVHVQQTFSVNDEFYAACICSAALPTGTTATVAGDTDNSHKQLAIGAIRIVHDGTLSVTTDFATNGSASLAHTVGTVSVAIGQSETTSKDIVFANATEEFEDDNGSGTNLGFSRRLHDESGDVTITDSYTDSALIANFSVS